MCGGLSRADGSSVACQPLALENGASPPAEWFPRAQGSGPRQPGSDGDSRSFRVNLHCKHPRNRYLRASPGAEGAAPRGRWLAHPAAGVVSGPVRPVGRHGARAPRLRSASWPGIWGERGGAAPTECRVGRAGAAWCPAPTPEILSHPTASLAVPHSSEGKLRQAPQRGVPARGGWRRAVSPRVGVVAARGVSAGGWEPGGCGGWDVLSHLLGRRPPRVSGARLAGDT